MRYLLTILAICFATSADAATLIGRVVDVHDGDTVVVEVRLRVHYADSPELKQKHGPEAAEFLRKMLVGRSVTFTPTGRSWNRTVADVSYEGKDVATEIVRNGNAWLDPRYKPTTELINLQADARRRKRGLWSDHDPIPPWIFRHPDKNPRLK